MADDPLETFPLLELPYVAQREFFHQLTLNDVLTFSFISRRCAALVKDANIRIGPMNIEIEDGLFIIMLWKRFTPSIGYLRIMSIFDCHPLTFPMRIISDSQEFDCKTCVDWPECVNIIHNPSHELFHSAARHIKFLFGSVSVNSMEMYCGREQGKSKVWRFPSFVDVTLRGARINFETYSKLLARCTITGRLLIEGNCQFIDLTLKDWGNLGHLVIRPNVEWFSRDHLKRLACRAISVHDTSVGSRDICQYMDSWMEGTERRVESITLTRRELGVFTLCNNLKYPWRVVEREGTPVKINDQTPRQLKMTRETDGSQMTVTVRPRCVVMNFQYKSQ